MIRYAPAVTTVVLISLESTAGLADEKALPGADVADTEGEDEERSTRDHALLVSMGFFGMVGANGVGGLMPTFGGGLERRIDDRLWLTARGMGNWDWHSNGEAAQRMWYLDLDLGIRHALTGPEVLEVSWLGSLGGRVMGSAGDHHAGYWAAQLRLGMALDKSFNDWCAIRVRGDVVEAGYGRGRDPYVSDVEHFHARFTLLPSFAARFAF
jgi:hypothetical protein